MPKAPTVDVSPRYCTRRVGWAAPYDPVIPHPSAVTNFGQIGLSFVSCPKSCALRKVGLPKPNTQLNTFGHSPQSEQAKGFCGFELHRSIEKPQRYRLMAKWETLENHTVDFRGSENFTEWRGLVGQYFASPPEVEHTETVLSSAP